MVHGAWCMVHGAWCIVLSAWCMVHGVWSGFRGFIWKQVFFLLTTRFRGNGSNDYAKLKSENGFVEQNRKLVHKCGFRFSVRESNRKSGSSESGPKPLNSLDFEGNV